MKKFKAFFVAMMVALLIPSVAFAAPTGPQHGPGEWDHRHTTEMNLYTDGMFTKVEVVKSYGGNFQLRFRYVDDPNNCYYVQLMESDPYSDPDGDEEIGGRRFACGNEEITWSIGAAQIDSGNGAEIYFYAGDADSYDDYIAVGNYD